MVSPRVTVCLSSVSPHHLHPNHSSDSAHFAHVRYTYTIYCINVAVIYHIYGRDTISVVGQHGTCVKWEICKILFPSSICKQTLICVVNVFLLPVWRNKEYYYYYFAPCRGVKYCDEYVFLSVCLFTRITWQESLANTKVNARQHCVSLSCLCKIAWHKFNGWFSCCCLPNTRNHAKFRENSTLQQFKVIQGHRSWCQSKAYMRLPISH